MPILAARKVTLNKIITAIVFSIIILPSCNAEIGSVEIAKGLYINYEGAEYEQTFIPCKSGAIWKVEGKAVLEKLSSIYKNSTLSKYGELYVEIKGIFSPIDKTQFPDSHYVGVFHLEDVVDVSTDTKVIDECR
jgi:hypothetical protein